MEMTIAACQGCMSHPYQDKKYKGQRAHTVSQDGKKIVCTVCGKEKAK